MHSSASRVQNRRVQQLSTSLGTIYRVITPKSVDPIDSPPYLSQIPNDTLLCCAVSHDLQNSPHNGPRNSFDNEFIIY